MTRCTRRNAMGGRRANSLLSSTKNALSAEIGQRGGLLSSRAGGEAVDGGEARPWRSAARRMRVGDEREARGLNPDWANRVITGGGPLTAPRWNN